MFGFVLFLTCSRFSTTQILVTIFLVANVSIQILAGVPDCIHANDGYGYNYPKPAIQLTEGGVSAYSVSPAVTTYTQGNAIKYSSLEESAYTSVTPASIVKQIVPAAPVITKSYVSPAVYPSAIPPTPIYTKAYLPPPIASVAPVITKSYLRPVNQFAYTAPLSKVATYTPTSSLVSIPAVKTVDYSYPKITTGYHASSVA